MPNSPDPQWIERRQRLQERFEELHPIRDSSHFAYMRGPSENFEEQDIRRIWAEVAADPSPGSLPPQNHVYVHVPFCKSICSFCNYERLKPSQPNLMQGWLERVLGSIETLGPVVAPLEWHSLYLGGGTPSILPAEMLDTLLSALHGSLRFHPDAGRHIELDPAVASPSRLSVLKKHGFQRFSFGIQSLDADNNALHNRGRQGKEIVDRCFSDLRDHGFDTVSCDFLLGLRGTTLEKILDDIRYVLEHHQPTNVDVFELIATQEYVNLEFGGSIEAFREHMRPFQEGFSKEVPEICREFGYRLAEGESHCFKLQREPRTGFPDATNAEKTGPTMSYTQLASQQQRPLNLLGFGTSARSQIFERAAFQYRDPQGDPAAPGPAWYEGHRVDAETEIRTYLVHALRDLGYVERAVFQAIFGVDIVQAVGVPIAVWQSMELVTLTPERLVLADQDPTDRARLLLWLVPDARLEYEIARIEGLDLSARGVANLMQEIPIGSELAPRFSFAGVREGRLILSGPDRQLKLRLAPALQEGEPLRIVVETPPSEEEAPDVALAVRRLRAFATRKHRDRHETSRALANEPA